VTYTIKRLWQLLLDGDTEWGTLAIRPQRWGATSYRIVMYPPGITAEQRRRVRLWRGCYAWGAALWLCATAVLSGFTTPWTAVVIASAITAAAGAVSGARAKDTRKLVRSAEVTVLSPDTDRAALARARLIVTIGAAMTKVDAMRNDGTLGLTQHELMWWHAYEQLDRNTAIPSFGRYGVVR